MIKSEQYIVKEWTIDVHDKKDYDSYLASSREDLSAGSRTIEDKAYEFSETLVDSREYCGLVRLSDGTAEIHTTEPALQGSYRKMRVLEDYDELKKTIDKLEKWRRTEE